MASSAEQEEKLSMLLAVAGDSVDAEMAKAMLESANWDVERALNGMLEDTVASSAPATVEPLNSSPVDAALEQSAEVSDDLSTEDLRAMLDAYEVDHSMCSEKADLANLLKKAVGGAMGHNPADAQIEAPPEFQSPQFDSAAAASSLPRSAPLGRLPAGCDVRDFPANWVHRLKVLEDKHPWATRSQVLGLLEKHSGAACVVDIELSELGAAKEEQARRNADRQREIEAQDQEFHESLLMDQHRETQRKEEESLRREAEELDRKLQVEKAQAVHEAELLLETKRSRVAQPEPDKAHPDRRQIVIRTPSGKRLTRSFLGSDDVSFIYDWIDVECAEEDFVKESYQVVARVPGQPNKELCKGTQSLKDEGVDHQSVFLISCS